MLIRRSTTPGGGGNTEYVVRKTLEKKWLLYDNATIPAFSIFLLALIAMYDMCTDMSNLEIGSGGPLSPQKKRIEI